MTGPTSPAPGAIEFRAALSGGARRRLGIGGRTATLGLQTGGIEVRGETSGSVLLPFSRIAKLRVGFEETKTGTILLLRLWLTGEDKPFRFGGNGDRGAYGRFIRATVARMLRDTPAIAIETGSGLFTPIFAISAFGTLTLGAAAFMIYLAATGDDWTIGLGPLGVLDPACDSRTLGLVAPSSAADRAPRGDRAGPTRLLRPARPRPRGQSSNTITLRATSPRFISANASLISSRRMRREIMSSSFSFPAR